MKRLLIQCANGVLLVIILIGIPAVTSARLGSLTLSSAPRAQALTLWAAALVGVANTVAALGAVKGRKEQWLCWKWVATFSVLLLIEYLMMRGDLNFAWLKEALQWLKRHG